MNFKLLSLLERFNTEVVDIMKRAREQIIDDHDDEETAYNFVIDEMHEILDEAIENVLFG